MKKKSKSSRRDMVWLSIIIVAALFLALLKISALGPIQNINLRVLNLTIGIILTIVIFVTLNNRLARYYNLRGLYEGSQTTPVLFLPKKYFKKESFWKGYLLWVISRASLIITVILLLLLGGEIY